MPRDPEFCYATDDADLHRLPDHQGAWHLHSHLTACGKQVAHVLWAPDPELGEYATCFGHPLADVFLTCRLLDARYDAVFRPAR